MTSFMSLASRQLFYSSFHTKKISEETQILDKRRNGKTSKQNKTSEMFFWSVYFPGWCWHSFQSLKYKEIWSLLFLHLNTIITFIVYHKLTALFSPSNKNKPIPAMHFPRVTTYSSTHIPTGHLSQHYAL